MGLVARCCGKGVSRVRSCRKPGRALLLLALLSLTLPPAAGAEEALRILHINDLHGWVLPGPGAGGGPAEGGLARMAALVREERTERTLFLAAGDLMQGTNISNLFQGRPVIEALGAMGLDASAVGNHEFDYGLEAFRKLAEEASFPFLAANVEGAGASFLLPSVIREVGGMRVALFGLTTEETPTETHPRNVRGLRFLSSRKKARQLVPELRRQADFVVCLSHLGLPGDEKLANSVEGIDVIVGGHTHTKIAEPLQVGSTIIVQAFERGAFLGRLDLTVEDGRVKGYEGTLLPVDGSAGEDREIAGLIERYRRETSSRMDEVVGRALVTFNGARTDVRSRETNLGNLVADVLRETAAADIAILNGGAIRAGIPAGRVTLAHLYHVLPFDGYALSFRLTGGEIREALETGLRELDGQWGGFPQVSGLSFTYDPEAAAGKRLREVLVGGISLEEGRNYTVATNDFLAAGGNNYRVFAGKEPLFNDSGRFLRDLLAESWGRRGDVAVGVEGRIRPVP